MSLLINILVPLVCVTIIIALIMRAGWWQRATKREEEGANQAPPQATPTPAAAPAAAGHGGGHDSHSDHGPPPWSSQVIAVLVVLFVLGGISAGVVWFVNRDEPAKETRTRQKESRASADAQRAPSSGEASKCSTEQGDVEEIVVPTEGLYGPIRVPRGHTACYGPGDIYQKLRFKRGYGDTPPNTWNEGYGSRQWVAIIPGESSEPLTVRVWTEPLR